MHSGTANAGHYWSYINTVRGMEEKNENDPAWMETDNDEWMEFNDSTVKDWKYSELKSECFGDKDKGGSSSGGMGGFGGWGGWGGKYGKSGYMLFYERKVKKPIKVVVPKEEVEKHQDLVHLKETDEHIKFIPYREGVDKVKPNQIFSKVHEDNSKFTFENDIYSIEFFEFVNKIMQSVSSFKGLDEASKEMRAGAIKVGKRASFDILARYFYNSSIKEFMQTLIDIFAQDDQLVLDFVKEILEHEEGEQIFEILLDCQDSPPRNSIGQTFAWLLAKCKMIEAKELESDRYEETISHKFMQTIKNVLKGRAAKAWTRFDRYLELYQAFALQSPEEVLDGIKNQSGVSQIKSEEVDGMTEAAKIGMNYFFKSGLIDIIVDFVFGEKVVAMGNTYSQPCLTPLTKIISVMTSK